MIKELFHFDIETCANYKDYTSFLQNDERGAKLFESKFYKMQWQDKYKSLDEAYFENAGIVSTYGRICCISFGYLDSNMDKQIRSFYGKDEMDIVNSFNELLKKIQSKNFSLCGFRINYFDIPWILHKLHKYNIEPASIIDLYGKKPWELRIVDMYDDWKQKFAWGFSFDEMCYELNVKSPKDLMNGSQVNQFYWSDRLEDIKTYCEKDVSSSIEVSKKIYK